MTAAAVPALLTLLLGALGLGRQAWRDEHATWWAASMPWTSLPEHLSQMDIVLLPYYLLMRVWIFVFGDSVVAMRLPSLLAMAAAAALTGMLGQRLYGPAVGLAGGCLFAVVPSASRYAQEARPYAFAIAFAVATLVVLLWVLQRPTWRRWALLSVVVALTGFAHLVALLVLFAHIPVVRHRMRPWLVAVGAGLVPVLPLAVLGARQTGQVWWIEASWKSLASLPLSLVRSAAVAGVLAALAIVGVFGRRWDWRLTMLAVWGIAPPLVLFALAHDIFYYRYLLFVVPAWAIAAGLALRGRAMLVAAVGAALLLGGRDQVAVRRDPLPGDQDYRAAASYVADHMSPSDGIRFSGYPDNRERLGFAYELRRRVMPPECEECAGRVWLVSNRPNATLNGFTVVETRTFPGIYLFLATPQ
ncbi:MAG TPA: glycosyltransferase family 39 protein [Candidatus Limnocylindrales bacterium]